LNQINKIAEKYEYLKFIVIKHHSIDIDIYNNCLISKNIILSDPLPYFEFIKLLSGCKFIISDSGGLQEEATYFRKKILICRNVTERYEVIQEGYGKLVNDNIIDNIKWVLEDFNKKCECPFGNGTASQKIVDILKNYK